MPEIDSLEEFPALLDRELAGFGASKPKVVAFFDWDDTLSQRGWQLKGTDGQLFDFHYLASPEAPRQLQSTIDGVMDEMGGG